MATEDTVNISEMESDISTLSILFNGHLVTYCIQIACKLNLASIIGEAGEPLSLNEIAEKIPGEVNLSYLKR